MENVSHARTAFAAALLLLTAPALSRWDLHLRHGTPSQARPNLSVARHAAECRAPVVAPIQGIWDLLADSACQREICMEEAFRNDWKIPPESLGKKFWDFF